MGTDFGSSYLDPAANLGIRARWFWRRAERRAVAEHERWLLSLVISLVPEICHVPSCQWWSSGDEDG